MNAILERTSKEGIESDFGHEGDAVCNWLIFPMLALFMIGATDYPAVALAKQPPQMSVKIKTLIRKEDSLDERCQAPGMDANGRVCLERSRILLKLIHLGWCWDTEKIDAPYKDRHWMRCSDARTVP